MSDLTITDIVDLCNTCGILKVSRGGALHIAITPFIDSGMLVLVEELKNVNIYMLSTTYKKPTF